MEYLTFLDAVIRRGISAAERDYADKPNKLDGAIAGFEACRGKTPDELRDLLKKANEDVARARAPMAESNVRATHFWWLRCYAAEVEWTCVQRDLLLASARGRTDDRGAHGARGDDGRDDPRRGRARLSYPSSQNTDASRVTTQGGRHDILVMSTKNLSRTVIEGGRTGYYKADVYKFARQERTATRVFLLRARRDPDAFDEDVTPVRKPVAIGQSDKLRPMYRFLDSAVGRPWADVRSEVFEKFDARTTAGRHVLFCHLLREVADSERPNSPYLRGASYVVDKDGILQKAERLRVRYTTAQPAKSKDYARAAEWLDERKVASAGSKLAWYVPASIGSSGVRVRVRAMYVSNERIAYVACDDVGAIIYDPVLPTIINGVRYFHDSKFVRPKLRIVANIRFRQDGFLNDDDVAFFNALPRAVRDTVLAAK